MEKNAYLILADGTAVQGRRIGAAGEARGELVFNTGAVGYLENLTDPAYHGQILLQSFPLIGNYGVIPADFASRRPWLSAYVVREMCDAPSNFRQEGKLDAYLKAAGVPGLCGVDTRALTRHLREMGAMNAALLDQLPGDMYALMDELRRLPDEGDAFSVCVRAPEVLSAEGDHHVVIWDFGMTKDLSDGLIKRNMRVTAVPAGFSAREILSLKPDGVLISAGPGHPARYGEAIRQIAALMEQKIPLMGLGLGHQMMAMAAGARCDKLRHGHRGANVPVRTREGSRMYITCQNHGYVVSEDALPAGVLVSMTNLNDGTVEGLDYPGLPAFSAQFVPGDGMGPNDTTFLYDRFIRMMEVKDTCL